MIDMYNTYSAFHYRYFSHHVQLVHAPIFEPDDNVTKCQLCAAGFTLTNRKHHCRGCGKVLVYNIDVFPH